MSVMGRIKVGTCLALKLILICFLNLSTTFGSNSKFSAIFKKRITLSSPSGVRWPTWKWNNYDYENENKAYEMRRVFFKIWKILSQHTIWLNQPSCLPLKWNLYLTFITIICHTKFRFRKYSKGQLISKCPFGVIVWTKIPTKKFDNFCPRI